jgi:hypothetical protein
MSSLIISPGWIGGNPFLLALVSSLMVVFKIEARNCSMRTRGFIRVYLRSSAAKYAFLGVGRG